MQQARRQNVAGPVNPLSLANFSEIKRCMHGEGAMPSALDAFR